MRNLSVTELLEDVGRKLRKVDKLSALLAGVRKIDESDTKTLERLIKERRYIEQLLRTHRIKNRDYDFQYTENFIEAVRDLLDKIAAEEARK